MRCCWYTAIRKSQGQVFIFIYEHGINHQNRIDNIKYKCLDLIYISNNINKNKTLVDKSNACKHFCGK